MSYFNEDQQSWTKNLASLPAESKCDCGWDLRGKCFGACYGDAAKGGFVPGAGAPAAGGEASGGERAGESRRQKDD